MHNYLVVEDSADVFENDGDLSDGCSTGFKLSRDSETPTYVSTHLGRQGEAGGGRREGGGRQGEGGGRQGEAGGGRGREGEGEGGGRERVDAVKQLQIWLKVSADKHGKTCA